jgi:hypothetical protein
MFLGHFAAGFALKAARPRLSLGWLLLAATWMDIVWSALLLAGVEAARIVPGITRANPLDLYDYPFSHSLLFALGWSALFYGLPRVLPVAAPAGRHRAGLVLAAAVFSHWLLDLLVHRPDLPLAPGASPKLGLDLWNYPALSIPLEGLLFVAGVGLYLRVTRARTGLGRWGMLGFAALLSLLFAMSFSAPPPNLQAVAVSGLFGTLLFIALAAWLDGKRVAAKP